MKPLSMLSTVLVALVVVSTGRGLADDKATVPLQVVVLIPAGTKGIAEGAKIKSIDTPEKTAAKEALQEVQYKSGKEEKRLNGTFVVKEAKAKLNDGTTVRCRILVAVEPGQTTLRDVRFVAPMQARGKAGMATWYGYTAVFDTPAPKKASK
jgi:hypothetical protein